MNIKNRLGNKQVKRLSDCVHNRLGIKNNQVKKRIDQRKELIVTSGDIRNKIIAKKRSSISDARDRLSEIARQGDARDKLNKMKVNKNNQKKMAVKLPKSQQKQNLNRIEVRKTIVNQSRKPTNNKGIKPSGLTGKTSLHGTTLIRTVKSSENKNTKVVKSNSNQTRSPFIQKNSNRYHPLKNNHNVVTIKNERARTIPVKKTIPNRSLKPQLQQQKRMDPSPVYINRPSMYDAQMSNAYEPTPFQPQWTHMQVPMSNMQMAPPIRPPQLRITTENDRMRSHRSTNLERERMDEDVMFPRYVPSRPTPTTYKRPAFDHIEEEYMPAPLKKQAILSSHMISRLDEQRRSDLRPGYKVIVTNLHAEVSLDDVEELFGNIGPIKGAKIIRSGVAEIIFVNETDAHKSVEIYHNRQLDRRAMNVIVVPNKQIPASSHQQRFSPNLNETMRRPVGITKSILRDAVGSLGQAHQSAQRRSSRRTDVSPDIYAIKQALFSANNALVAANQQYRSINQSKHPYM